MIAGANNLWEIIKLGKHMFLRWLKSLCSKYSNLIVNSLRNEFFRVTIIAVEAPKEIVAAIFQVEKSVRREVVQACDPQRKV
jgi:hypothetical protein